MLLDAIKAAVRTYIPVAGNKIKRIDHVNANDTMISELYYSDWGMPKPYLANTLPEGYVWCNVPAQTVNVADCHPAFVAKMGPMFPVYGGDGLTTIGIPYIPGGSSLVQAGTIVIGTSFTTIELGAVGGAAGVALDITQIPQHRHKVNGIGIGSIDGTGAQAGPEVNGGDTPIYTEYIGGSGGITQAHNNMSPYYVVNYILRIK